MWFRKSLRLHDNAPLVAACDYASKYGTVLPVFILDKWTSKQQNVGDVRFEFLLQSLRCLDKNLKARGLTRGLLFFQGEPEAVLPALWKFFSVDAMAWDDSEENEIHDRVRDRAIIALAEKNGVHTMHDRHTHWLHSPLTYVRTLDEESVPKTYTEFLSMFGNAGPVASPLSAPSSIPFKFSDAEMTKMIYDFLLPDGNKDVVFDGDITGVPSDLRPPIDIKYPGGEDEGLRRLVRMVIDKAQWVAQFEKSKTSAISLEPSTTVLSPYLSHGCLSMRTAWHAVQKVYRESQGEHTQPPGSLAGGRERNSRVVSQSICDDIRIQMRFSHLRQVGPGNAFVRSFMHHRQVSFYGASSGTLWCTSPPLILAR